MAPQRLQPLKDNLKVIAQARINWPTMVTLTSGGFDALPPSLPALLCSACHPAVACQAGHVTQDNPAPFIALAKCQIAQG